MNCCDILFTISAAKLNDSVFGFLLQTQNSKVDFPETLGDMPLHVG